MPLKSRVANARRAHDAVQVRKPRRVRLQQPLTMQKLAQVTPAPVPSVPPTYERDPTSVVRIIDRYVGTDGERILQALAVIALGNEDACLAFFGSRFRVQPRERVNALHHLSMRRWGRPTLNVEMHGAAMPVQIINVFTDVPEELPDDPNP
jgi:hypothetical protein